MAEPILYIDTSDIQVGHLATVRELMADLVDFVEANEPQLIAYNFYVEESDNTMTCVVVHPDSQAREAIVRIAALRFAGTPALADPECPSRSGPSTDDRRPSRRRSSSVSEGRTSGALGHRKCQRFDAPVDPKVLDGRAAAWDHPRPRLHEWGL